MGRSLALALVLTCIASATEAQLRSRSEGLFLNAHVTGTSLNVEDADSEQGAGLGLGLGYGFRNRLAIYVNADASSMSTEDAESFNFGHGELGVRYTLGNDFAKLRPFLDASIGMGMAWQDDALLEVDEGLPGETMRVDFEMSGPVYGIGGGVAYHFSPALALAAGVRVGFGKFTSFKIDNITIDLDKDEQVSFTSTRLNVGLAWFPTGRSVSAAQR
jgi:hypothetical protein